MTGATRKQTVVDIFNCATGSATAIRSPVDAVQLGSGKGNHSGGGTKVNATLE